MASVIQVFSSNIISALCGMIVHSIWQGGLLAVFVSLALILTRNKSSAFRYNLLVASLVLFSIATFYTFFNGIATLASHVVTGTSNLGHAVPSIAGKETILMIQPSLIDKMIMYLNANSVIIVCVWFIIVCLRSLQLVMGIRSVFLLRYKQVSPAGSYWEFRVKELSSGMGITTVVRVMESGIAKIPMVIGHLKPLILIPLGMFSHLPEAELEAILIHELAHIRRRDYLVNILQSLLEIVFFFNPAVLWISALVKREREHCCDDITIETSSSKVVYIKALVACQEYMHRQPMYAMALNGKKKHLLSRVKRLVSNDRKPMTYIEKSILAICILTAALLFTFFSYGEKKENVHTVTTNTISVTTRRYESSGSINPKTTSIKIYKPNDVGNGTSMKYVSDDGSAYVLKENNVLYQLFVKEGRAGVLYINGKEIPAGKLPGYSTIVDKLMMLYNNENEVAEVKEVAPVQEAYDGQSKADVNPFASPVQACIALPVNVVVADERPVAIAVHPVIPATPKENTYQSKELITDMINDNIITEQGNSTLSFKLSNAEFVVNGIKQPEPVYSKYKSKYIKPSGHSEVTWYYNYDSSSEPH